MSLAFNFEEIAPRELRPEVYELEGISRAAVEAHFKLYQGYVNKRNEILGKLAGVDLAAANQVYSEIRALKVDLSFAIGGILNKTVRAQGGPPGGGPGAAHPPQGAAGSGLHQQVRGLGRGAAGLPVPGDRRQGPGDPERPLRRHRR